MRQAECMINVTAEPLAVLRGRTSVKWRMYPPDVLPLFVAEMDYPLAPLVSAAMVERILASDTGYVADDLTVGPAFASFAAARWNWRIDPANVRTTTDVSVAIAESLRVAIRPGDGVIITPPVYPPFFDLVPEAGGTVVEVPLLEPTGTAAKSTSDVLAERGTDAWRLDLVGIERAFAAGARAMLLCHPHNPLGLVHTREQLVALAALAERFDAIVISDEIHSPLVHKGVDFAPFLSVSDAARGQGICVTSASKAFNLAGVKCAVMIADSARMISLLDTMPEEVGYRTSILGVAASIAGFEQSTGWLDAVIVSIERNSTLLGKLLAEHLPRVSFRPPRASYLAWLDFRGASPEWGTDPSIRALEVARVALNPGPTFGSAGIGHARLNLACSAEVLTDAVLRLAAADTPS